MRGLIPDIVNALADKGAAAVAGSASKDRVTYSNGDFYDGETVGPPHDLIRHGFGFYRYSQEQSCYEGEFVNEERQGHGLLFEANGGLYVGQWLGSKEHGRGIAVHWAKESGLWVYDGEFSHGSRAGWGVLQVRGKAGLYGAWADGSLLQGVEVYDSGSIKVILNKSLAVTAPQSDNQVGEGDVELAAEQCMSFCEELSGVVPEWSSEIVSKWLSGLGLEEVPELAQRQLDGSQLLALQDTSQLVTHPASEVSLMWHTVLATAHACLRRVVRSQQATVNTWSAFQQEVPGYLRMLIAPDKLHIGQQQGLSLTRLAALNGLQVELVRLPVDFPSPPAAAEDSQVEQLKQAGFALEDIASILQRSVESLEAEMSTEGEEATASAVLLPAAQAWAAEVELLSLVEHSCVRKLLGIATFGDETGLPRSALVYRAPECDTVKLFEWLHHSSQDESRALSSSSTLIALGKGICEGMATLAARGIVVASLSSLSIEVVLSGSAGLVPRLTRCGASWWRWGWERALLDVDCLQPTSKSLESTEDASRKFAECPVNWLAPEVLCGDEPTTSSDVYALGAILWELEYRAVPLSELSVVQIIGAVGYGKWRKHLKATSPPSGTSSRAVFLHDTMLACCSLDATKRPALQDLLASMSRALLKKS